ncbi:aminotransferase class I/II-fold pyridoxal phosphate-dependent enzyme [Vibrio sp. DW001]|uniref:threonine-phosphate decarboxylase n=1 Tax=Vibrio sp. DW001 TaxID=2912315 RepID=UPI0023AE8137|nr:threonine-phosphate decarboxylase [Vibrio sp. DW001]WED28722.1 aminotransferase class I/II-fold pyridoxal phosphate-dependent enzyme [Vibrio sp. DW001]
MIKHGGNLLQITKCYGGDIDQWVDLSTGVSPYTYPISDLPDSVWNQLPQENDGLEVAAKNYYQSPEEPLAVAGSQAAIMLLPDAVKQIRGGRTGVVALPKVGYKEHQHAWCHNRTGSGNDAWQVVWYDDMPTPEQINQCDVVVIINPNNPTGYQFDVDYLLTLHQALVRKNGILIVDEAFIDIHPQKSILCAINDLENLIVLRSIGKFFGLAGARVGFLYATEPLKSNVAERLGPWAVTGPSRWVVKHAIVDHEWQNKTSKKIEEASSKLKALLSNYLTSDFQGTPLFTTVYVENAPYLHEMLCQHQVFTRLCDEMNAVRFGLPASAFQWDKLESALVAINQEMGQL